MSQLRVTADNQDEFFMNVLSFSSPIFGDMTSAQTRSQKQYFPIKAYQPEINFDVIFPSEKEYEAFQNYVRVNQVNSQSAQPGHVGVTLNWPQRSIINWTGVITKFKAGGMRRNYTPRASFQVQLVDSLVSNQTQMSSFGADWTALFTGGELSALQSVVSLGQSILAQFIPGLGR